MIERRLRELWLQLQGKKPHLNQFLSEIYVDGIRGIDDLRVNFDYPVSVIAGENSSGKSTVLFAAACAYRVPGAGVRDFVPSTLFPDYRPRAGDRGDEYNEVTLEYGYSTQDGHLPMRWRRTKGWNRSFLGRKNAEQPERQVYLRTLSNLRNPSEVRGVLSMSRGNEVPEVTPLTASQLEFARRMLPFQYSEVVDLSSGKKNLLFASQKSGASYSELHMAAGERAILRLSQEIAHLKGALVLIDEVEAGLHPWVQQLLMLHLQQLALRNDLQVIATSHSPVVLDSVPPNGRIFLERNIGGVVSVVPAYRDIVQNALYGRSSDGVNLLCEDDAAEGVLRGILDYLLPQLGFRHDSVSIGRNTGAEEFPAHASAFGKFGQIGNFIFVLDGDKSASKLAQRIRDNAGQDVPVVFLPGSSSTEHWVLSRLERISVEAAKEFGMKPEQLNLVLNQLDNVYASTSDKPSRIAKSKLREFAELVNSDTPNVSRIVGRIEAGIEDSEVRPAVERIGDALTEWRSRGLS